MELNITNSEYVTVGDIESINVLDTYFLSDRVARIYTTMTRGNDFLTYKEVKKKLIRNIILSDEAPVKIGLERKRVFYFGNLIIQTNEEEHSICYIDNREGNYRFKLNREKRKALNEIMRIEEK